MKNDDSQRFTPSGDAEDQRAMPRQEDVQLPDGVPLASRPSACNSSFAAGLFDVPLAGIGLMRSSENRWDTGVCYRGDGRRSFGWFHAWSYGCDFVVVRCDFTMARTLPFSIDFRSYFAVRREVAGLLAPAEAKAFLETNPRPAAMMMPQGCRCRYTEIEYYDGYCERNLGGSVAAALGPVAESLQHLNDRGAWSGDVMRILRMIEESDARGRAADLFLRGAADELMSGILRLQHEREGGISPLDRRAILLAADHIQSHVDRQIRQDELLAITNMGATKFKRLFKALMGETPSGYIVGARVERAQGLLLDGGLGIDEIAQACGYGQPTSFSTMFRNRTGFSPREWRRFVRVSFSGDPQTAVREHVSRHNPGVL